MAQTEILDDPDTLLREGYGCKKPRVMFVGISSGRLGAQITRVAFTNDASGRIFQHCILISEVKSVKPKKIPCLGQIVFDKLHPLYPKQALYLPHLKMFQSRGALKLGSPAFDLWLGNIERD